MSASALTRFTAACCALFAFHTGEVSAQLTLASDNFELAAHPTGNRTVVGAASGMQFFTRNAPGANYDATIGSDPIFGSNVLRHAGTTSTTSANNHVIGLLPITITLANVNDFITLDFEFRYLNSGTATSNGAGFRFGIWGDNGTPVTGDNQPTISDDDQGYYVQTGVGTTTPGATNLFYNEAGGTFPIGGGTDRSVINASGAGIAFNDGNIHSASFTIRRTSATAISLSVTYDGTSTFTGSTSTNLRTSFSEIAFTDGFVATPVQFAIDNVQVTSSVPEPGVGLMCLAGVAAVSAARRRGR